MIIAVAGLWHLGSVTAACLASAGNSVIGLDESPELIADLTNGKPPVAEPGLADLIRKSVAEKRLTFAQDINAISEADVCWITYDTPVNDEDVADVDFVLNRVAKLFPVLRKNVLIVVSSQVPVGSTSKLEEMYSKAITDGRAQFVYSPENLRLGKAIEVFTKPDRVVVGTRTAEARARMTEILKPFTNNIEWMSVESAEMTKHALNAFLACSVAFINEVAALCERAGADAREVERGLKSDIRIGSRAYLKPGPAFAGGTLARDVTFLSDLGKQTGSPTRLLSGIRESNLDHKDWLRRRLSDALGALQGKTLAVLGLTYKPRTDTLRRSSAVEVCRWLFTQGVRVRAFDPAVRNLPSDLSPIIQLCPDARTALSGADAALIATEWPEFTALKAEDFTATMAAPRVFDPSRFLETALANRDISYFAIGKVGGSAGRAG